MPFFMKIKPKVLLCMIAILSLYNAADAQVGIDTSSPDPSAMLEVNSASKGFLPPRMTTIQRDAIVSPAIGLTIFNTTSNCLQWHVGANIWHDACSPNLYQQYPVGSNFCNVQPTAIVDVTNPVTGRTWMDRNLGANRAAISSTDAQSYGWLYQWGRGSDGHQCVHRYVGDGVTTSGTTTTLSSLDAPGHGDFIIITGSDWRSPRNNNLWQGVDGTNNPCPRNYRLPSHAELNDERLSWSSNNNAGAFASPLKFPTSGLRNSSSGFVVSQGTASAYWSSSINGANARFMSLFSIDANININTRGLGYSVRCIKN